MPPQQRAPCQICNDTESKYACAQCRVLYCSLPCYKTHKATPCQPSSTHPTSGSPEWIRGRSREVDTLEPSSSNATTSPETAVTAPQPELRPLTSLRWPYVPEESAYPDPLKRDDPKPLQMHQYEAIATSSSIRRTLATHPQLPDLLRSIDRLRGPEREEALERALGVAPSTSQARSEEDTRALRELAEAVEAAVRGGKQDVLGLDWGD